MDQRAATRMPRRWKALFGTQAPTQAGFTQDISATGLFITASQLPKLGTRLVVKLETASAASTEMHGEVVRHVVVPPELRSVKRHGFGVRLVGDCAAMKQLIDRDQRSRGNVMGPLVAPETPPGHRRAFSTEAEFLKARAEELMRGALSFSTSRAVALNTAVEVTVSFGWTRAEQVVRGRCVHVRAGEGGAHAVILMVDEPQQTLEAMDRLARR
ncbi:MAG: PilZ domain-containing protein [Myxococcaceae bacterium]|nr:PilZ domain-containing protein [Myxococcaceae bacterium]